MVNTNQKPDVQGLVAELQAHVVAPISEDLNNQILSDDPLQRTRQLEWQAQLDEQRLNGV